LATLYFLYYTQIQEIFQIYKLVCKCSLRQLAKLKKMEE
jgi:hypothetical protein